jgi:DNA-binding response OmpR family regulator
MQPNVVSSSDKEVQPTGASTNPGAPISHPRVLIVDDDPQGVELIEAYLCNSDYEIRTAPGGEEALGVVRQWHPDLVLLDIMMPKVSGFEVCKRLRANPSTRDIAVLMITALDQPSDVEKAVEAGANDFLTKPINKNELLLRVRSMLKAQSYKRDLDRALAYIDAVQSQGN